MTFTDIDEDAIHNYANSKGERAAWLIIKSLIMIKWSIKWFGSDY